MVYSLIITLMVGLLFFLPSGVINLRLQESIFPIVAIGLFLATLIYGRSKAVSCLLAFIVVNAIWQFTPASWSLLQTAIILGGFYLAVVYCYPTIKSKKQLIYNVLCGIALLNVLWLILQRLGINIFFEPRYASSLRTGFFANSNEVSIFLAMLVPCFFRGYWHLGLIPMSIGLMLASSSIGVIATIIIVITYLMLRHRSNVAIVIGSLVWMTFISTFFFYKIDQPSVSLRLNVWRGGWELIKARPLTGWGLGQTQFILPLISNPNILSKKVTSRLFNKVLYQQEFKGVYLKTFNQRKKWSIQGIWSYLHNEYLQIWIEVGLIGLMLFLGVMFSTLLAYLKTRQRDAIPLLSVLAILIGAGAMFPFHIGRLLFLMILFLAFIKGEEEEVSINDNL